jgi:ABC-type multidrug transport system ATPase subunit
MTPTVHVDHLTRRYSGQLALDDVTCVLQPDTITGLLGRNAPASRR